MPASQALSPLNRFLHVLGVPEHKLKTSGLHHCPMHPESNPSLRATRSPVAPGGYHFRCSFPRCNFQPGSAVDLVMHKCSLGQYEALKAFGPGGKLADTLIKTGTDAQDANDIISLLYASVERQNELRKYLETCHSGLCTTDAGQNMAAVLKGRGIRPEMLPKLPIGIIVQPAPSSLPSLGAKGYVKNTHLVFPYSCGGVVTALEILAPFGVGRETVDLSGQNIRAGIFMENLLAWPVTSLIVCFDERDAMLLHSRGDETSHDPRNIVCLQGPDALDMLPDLKTVTLVTHDAMKLSIETALTYSRSPSNIQVFQPTTVLVSVDGSHVSSICNHSVPVWDWITGKVLDMYNADGPDAVAEVLSAGALTDKDKERLLASLGRRKHIPEPLLHVIKKVICSTMIRTLGRRTLSKSAIYRQLAPSDLSITNFTMQVSRVTTNTSGDKVLCGMLCPADSSLPPFQVEIPSKELIRPPINICQYLWAQAADRGITFRPSLELPSGLGLLQVVTLFENAEMSGSARMLGVSRTSVDYPHVSIDTSLRKTAICSEPAGYRDTVQLYAAIHNVDPVNTDQVTALLSSTDDTVRSFNLLLGHILHQTAATAANNTTYHLHHLMLPSRCRGFSMWLSVLRQLAMLFSGISTVPTMPSAKRRAEEWLRRYSGLNNLPLICSAMDLPAETLAVLMNSDLPLVCVLDSDSATNFNSVPGTAFLADDMMLFDTDNIPTQLPVALIEAVRANWVPALLDACSQYNDDRATSEAMLPAMAGYRMMCRTFGATPADMSDLISAGYTKEAINTPEVFLAELSNLVRLDPRILADNLSQLRHSGRTRTGMLGCYTPDSGDITLLKRRCLRALSGSINSRFNRKQLDTELTERGMLLPNDDRVGCAHWNIPAKVWNKLAGRQIPELKMVRSA